MKTRKNSISFSTQLLGWLIIALIGIVGIVSVIEIAARIMLPNINVLLTIVSPTEDDRNYALKPNASTVYKGLYEESTTETVWNINSQGLRSDIIVGSKKDDIFRIASYGDSETFGWSVDINDTWQRQMEILDSSVEVINLGVPGYNIASIAAHVEETLPTLQADMAVYLFNKNDVYKPLSYHPLLSKSYVYLIVNMGLYQLKSKQRKEWRNSDQGSEYFQFHLQRIFDACKKQNVPLLLAIQHWKYIKVFPDDLQSDQNTGPAFTDNNSNTTSAVTINVEKVIENFPSRDAHLTEPAHQALAKHVCHYLSNGNDKKCRP